MTLTYENVLVLSILAVAVLLFVTEKLRSDVVALLVLLALALTNLLSPDDALSGFSHSAVITIIGVFIISAGLYQTGVAHRMGSYLTKIAGHSEVRLTATIMLAAAAISAIMNNVGATAVLLPVVVGLARQNNIRPSKLLIPLSFGSLQGGLLTVIGRPANIIVSDALETVTGEPFGFFAFTSIGLILLIVGILYMVLIGRRMLPERAVEDKLEAMLAAQRKALEQYHLGERLFEVRVLAESPLVDLSIEESRLGRSLDLNVVGIVRNGTNILSPGPDELLAADDLLLIQGSPEEVMRLRWTRGVEVEQEITHLHLEDIVAPELAVVEAVLTPRSTLIGHTIRDVDFRREYGLTVLAIWRDGQPYRTALGNIILRFGDTLLLQGTHGSIHRFARQPDLLVLGDEQEPGTTRPERAPVAALIMFLMIVLIAGGVTPVAIGSLLAAVLMVLTGCLTIEDAYTAIDWKSVFLMAGMLPLGLALAQTGTAAYLAERVSDLVGGLGPQGLLAGIFMFNLLASQVMSSVAAAALMAPIAVSTAQMAGANPEAFLVAVAVSGSLAFMTPISHQANVLVMGPGGYRFTDYSKVGVPMALLLSVIAILLLPIFWPL
jgi:di/tricarboxylate transporter